MSSGAGAGWFPLFPCCVLPLKPPSLLLPFQDGPCSLCPCAEPKGPSGRSQLLPQESSSSSSSRSSVLERVDQLLSAAHADGTMHKGRKASCRTCRLHPCPPRLLGCLEEAGSCLSIMRPKQLTVRKHIQNPQFENSAPQYREPESRRSERQHLSTSWGMPAGTPCCNVRQPAVTGSGSRGLQPWVPSSAWRCSLGPKAGSPACCSCPQPLPSSEGPLLGAPQIQQSSLLGNK